MNIIDDEITISLREGIILCIDNGIKGAQSQLDSFDKTNRFGTNQQIALKLNLETLVEEAEVIGSGKRGYCILSKFRPDVIERITGNTTNGQKPTENDFIMDECIMIMLIKFNNRESKWMSYTINTWVKELGFFDVTEKNFFLLHKKMNELYLPMLKEKNIANMLGFLKANTSERKWSVVDRGLDRLQKSNRISISYEYVKEKYFDSSLYSKKEYELLHYNRHVDISKEEFYYIEDYEKELVNNLGVEWSDYTRVKSKSFFAKRSVKETVKGLDKEMRETFNIIRYYKKIRIEVLDESCDENIDIKGFNPAFVERYIELTNDRLANNSDYTSGESSYGKQFYKTNLFILLNHMGYKEFIESEYNDLLLAIPYQVDKVKKVNRVTFTLKEEQEISDQLPF